METGVAVLGTYEDEPFDQHTHLQAQIDAGLTDSVSFGRFANDNISWVKRSSFNHNQYLEELGNCSAPGSVRQKKAYFEAYYKAKREREALEKALAEANSEAHTTEDSGVHFDNGQHFDEVIDPESRPNVMSYDRHETIDEGMEENYETLVQQVAVETSAGENPDLQPSQEDVDPVSSVDNEGGHSPELYMEYQDVDESQNSSKDHGICAEFVSDEHQNGVVIDFAVDNLDEPQVQSDIVTKEILYDTICDSITAEDKVDDKRDAEMVDKFETSKIQPESVQKSSTLSTTAGMDLKVQKATKRKSVQNTSLKTSNMGSVASSTASKVGKSKDSRKQGPLGVTELKCQQHTNVTVPQPFALATNKRAAATGVVSVSDRIPSSGKPLRNGSFVQSSPMKKAEAPVKNAKTVNERRPTSGLENRTQKEKSQPRSKTPNDVRRQINPSTKTLKQESAAIIAAPNAGRLTNSIKSRPSPAKIRNSTFSFKSDERAEKRKEFNSKLEAKLSAKEAEKNQAEAKTQEEAEEEIKQLRKSLKFKAIPMPTFYQDNVQSKLESKKNAIPTTRAKSPKLGRKTAPDVNLKKDSLTDLRLSKSATSVQKRPSKPVMHSERPKENTSGVEDVSLNNPPGEAVQYVEPNTSDAVQDINTDPVEPDPNIVTESKATETEALQNGSPKRSHSVSDDGGNPSISSDVEHAQESKVSTGPKKRAETPLRSKRVDISGATTPGRRSEGKPGITPARTKSDGQNATSTTRGERTPVRDRLKAGLSSATPGNKVGNMSSSKSSQKPVKKDAANSDVGGTVKEVLQA